jgi:hypothetical protein
MWQIATIVDESGVIAYYCIYRPPAVAIVSPGHQVSQVQGLNERLGAPVIVWAHQVEVVGETPPGALTVIRVEMFNPDESLPTEFFGEIEPDGDEF